MVPPLLSSSLAPLLLRDDEHLVVIQLEVTLPGQVRLTVAAFGIRRAGEAAATATATGYRAIVMRCGWIDVVCSAAAPTPHGARV